MVHCCVAGCNNTYKKSKRTSAGIRFFSIPAVITNQCDKTRELSEERRRIWLERINRKDFTVNDINSQATVCSMHFLTGAPAKLFQEIHPDWAPSVRMGRPIRLKPKSRAFLSSQSIIQSRVLKKKKNEEKAGRDSKPKIVESSERKGNKINSQDKLSGILFEHFYCKKVSSDNNSHPESSDIIICDSEKPSPSENKELEPISQTVPNKANSNKVDVACMTAITSDYVTYMQDELNKIKKNSSYKEQILKSTNDIAEIAEMNNINLQGQLAAAKTELEMYRKDNIALREEIIAMRSCISQLSLNQAALKTDNNKVKLYTGFPNFKLLNHFYNFIASDFQTHLSNSLNKFEEFLVVLMRLRLNASGRDLGYRFGVSQGTISRICSRWIPIMAQKLEGLEWSEKISFRKNVPICFREVFEDQFVKDIEESGKVAITVENIQKIKAKVKSAQISSKDE